MMCFVQIFATIKCTTVTIACWIQAQGPREQKRAVMVTAPSLINYINEECKNAAKIHVKLVVLKWGFADIQSFSVIFLLLSKLVHINIPVDLIIDLIYTF